MKRDVLESGTTDNSSEAAVFSKRETFEACCERILNTVKQNKPSLEDVAELERLVIDCLAEDNSELTTLTVRTISELLFKRQEVLSLQLKLQIVEELSQKLTDVLCSVEEDATLCADAEEMILNGLQLLWFMITINCQVKGKAVDSLPIETLFELMQRTESCEIKRLALKLISIVNKARENKAEEQNAKLLNCCCDVLTSDSDLSLKVSALEMIDVGEAPCLNSETSAVDTLWKKILKVFVSCTDRRPETPTEDSTNTAIKEWELLTATMRKIAAFIETNPMLAYASLRSGFVLKIDSWLRVREVHSTYLFGKDNCRLASFLKQLETLLQVEGIQICDDPFIEELTSLFCTSNSDSDEHSITKVDSFWDYTCCIQFHCAWLVMLEALASHAMIANSLITTSLHKCWIKYLTESLLEIENVLDPDHDSYVILLQLKSACVRLLMKLTSKQEFANEIIKQHQILSLILPNITFNQTESVILGFHNARLLSELLRNVSRFRRDTNKHFLHLIKILESAGVNLSSHGQTSIDQEEFGTVLRQLYVIQEEMKTDLSLKDPTPLTLNVWHALDQPEDIQINFLD